MLKKSLVVLLLLVSAFFLLTGCDQLYFKDYEASGVLKDSDGVGIENATVNFSDGSSVKTQVDGSWKQTGLNGTIIITPFKDGYTFTPSSKKILQLDENKNDIEFIGNTGIVDNLAVVSDVIVEEGDFGYYYTTTVENTGLNTLYNATITFKIYETSAKETIIDTVWDYIANCDNIDPGEKVNITTYSTNEVNDISQMDYYNIEFEFLVR